MYNSTVLADRIKSRAKDQHIQLKDIWKKVGITDNTLTNLRKGSMLGADKLAMIADYLRCSTDYLLGRTNNPNVATDTYINGNNNGVQAISNGHHSSLTVNGTTGTDKATDELVDLVQSLPLIKKAEAIIYLNQLKKENEK